MKLRDLIPFVAWKMAQRWTLWHIARLDNTVYWRAYCGKEIPRGVPTELRALSPNSKSPGQLCDMCLREWMKNPPPPELNEAIRRHEGMRSWNRTVAKLNRATNRR